MALVVPSSDHDRQRLFFSISSLYDILDILNNRTLTLSRKLMFIDRVIKMDPDAPVALGRGRQAWSEQPGWGIPHRLTDEKPVKTLHHFTGETSV